MSPSDVEQNLLGVKVVLKGKKFTEKYVDFKADSKEDLEFYFRNGLQSVHKVYDKKISPTECMVNLYKAISFFESIDYRFGSPVLKKFTDSEDLIRDFHHDMSLVSSDEDNKMSNFNDYKKMPFKTSLTIEGALFILVALARNKQAFGKDIVKGIMDEEHFDLDKYCSKESLEEYIKFCKGNNFDVIKRLKDS